ncbi:MAG: hypothetical protein E7443_03980 [Ruminococcaceae bacterium]|nr:hypothetical protein [Oscillospiraceae bacterium]
MENYSVKYKKQIADMKYFLEAYYDTYAINYTNAKRLLALLRTENDEHIVLTITFSNNGIMGGITKPINFKQFQAWLKRKNTIFDDGFDYIYAAPFKFLEYDDSHEALEAAVNMLLMRACREYGFVMAG